MRFPGIGRLFSSDGDGGQQQEQPNNNGDNNNNIFPNMDSIQHTFEEMINNFNLQAAMAASLNELQQPTGGPQQPAAGPPPTSARQILPQIIVLSQDLVDPTNRECSICLESITLKSRVVRLPCAHLFHPACIKEWLNKHCTCAVCRYELPTDDPVYEQGRRERMKDRKLRFARHELQNMSIRQLKNMLLLQSNNKNNTNSINFSLFKDKNDLIDALVQSKTIDLITTPDPVQYRLSDLQNMRISQLKACMNDAGVFFDSTDVLEKADMICTFISSGRLELIHDSYNEKPASSNQDDMNKMDKVNNSDASLGDWDIHITESPYVVETVSTHDDGCQIDTRACTDTIMEENMDYIQSLSTIDPFSTEVPTDEVQHNADTEQDDADNSSDAMMMDVDIVLEGTSDMNAVASSDKHRNLDYRESETGANESALPDNITDSAEIELSNDSVTPTPTPTQVRCTDMNEPYNDCDSDNNDLDNLVASLQTMSLTELIAYGKNLSIDLSSCFERGDIINCIVRSQETINRVMNELERLDVSSIRALAFMTNIDLSCALQHDLIMSAFRHEMNVRIHLQSYLLALIPLVESTTPQLRALAREWNVRIDGCIERDEILQRLVENGIVEKRSVR